MKKASTLTALICISITVLITLTSGDSKRYGGGGRDMVEELYEQAVKQNDNLESIEEGIEKFAKKKTEALEKYNGYTSYNNRYYGDAKMKTSAISDATTRQRAGDLISKSEARYRAGLADWQNTISTLNTREKELNDLHVLLKIMISEPMMEKYQGRELPDNTKLKEAGNDLQQVIDRIRAITK